jgi:hypothetical protein
MQIHIRCDFSHAHRFLAQFLSQLSSTGNEEQYGIQAGKCRRNSPAREKQQPITLATSNDE